MTTRVVALTGLLAIIASISAVIADPSTAGLEPGHGHVSLNGVIPPHEHGFHEHDDHGSGNGDDVSFTLGSIGSVVVASNLAAALELRAPALTTSTVVVADEVVETFAPAPLRAPPRL